MIYVDYSWDLNEDGMVLDEDLNIFSLGWRHGDYFRLVVRDGKKHLIKLDPIEAFARGLAVNDNKE